MKNASYLTTEAGKANAERFLKALKERRILAVIKSVSSTGMSRQVAFREISTTAEGNTHILQFDYFLNCLGYPYGKQGGIIVRGCGMDMIFNTLYNVCSTLKEAGFNVPEDFPRLADSYLTV